jgi:nucleotide-binding universal stress UspA family protein
VTSTSATGDTTSTILLCTDGSELAERALAAGVAVVARADRVVVAIAIEPFDSSMLSGVSGFGGGTMTPEQYDAQRAAERAAAEDVLRRTVAALGLEGAETTVVEGDPGTALCELAASLPATVMVAGSRGRGGLKRALLGSVSDHLVRHAPCPIVITPPE